MEGTESLARFSEGDEFGGYSVITQRKLGKGKIILVGSVISHKDLLRLVNKSPIAQASENIILTLRDNGVIIAVETGNARGYMLLNGEYTDILTGRKLAGKTDIPPYEVLILNKQV